MSKATFVIIPEYSQQTSRWEVKVDLSGKRYTINVSWNAQMEGWVMALMDSDVNLILGGIRLSQGSDLLAKYKAYCKDLPPGDFYILDQQGDYKTAELSRTNFSTRYLLCYDEGEADGIY
ncbi:hypothetical protein AGMMS49944_09110 [Spirochaetia bacterium]|nr:hypothetical protein AGMMS49944_09110 [Spirochaetia bacterium]